MSSMVTLRTHDPILPNRGLGGVNLRTPIAQLQDMIAAAYVAQAPKNDWYGCAYPFEARYRLGPVEIAVDVRNGKVFKLSALEGYRGRLFGRIAVGMKVRDAMLIEPRLYYDEAEELVLCSGCTGVSLDVPEIDPDPATIGSYPITAISVFAEEAFTPEGMEGRW